MNLDTKSVKGHDGAYLSGDLAARLLDIAGVVTNRNTIPGDKDPLNPSGLRLGSPEITRLGMKEGEMEIIAQFYERALLKKEDLKKLLF